MEKFTYCVFPKDGQPYFTDDPPADSVELTMTKTDMPSLRLEGEAALQFLDAAGSGWIREELNK